MAFGIPQHTVSDYVEAGCKGLARFVENNLGLRTIIRRVMMSIGHNVERFYGLENPNAVVTVWDATYEYLPKSSNFRFQAAVYSGHKSRNPIEPMVAVTLHGKILNIFGPENLWRESLLDADILKQLMKLEEFKTRLKPGDIFVTDRGFQNVKEQLGNQGYIVKIQPHRAPKQKQLKTAQENEQRDCTAVRWIIEVINRRLKCNQYLLGKLGI